MVERPCGVAGRCGLVCHAAGRGRCFAGADRCVCAGGRTHQNRHDCRGPCCVRICPAACGEKVAECAEAGAASGSSSQSHGGEDPSRRAAIGGNALHQQACCQGADPGGAVLHAPGLSIALQACVKSCAGPCGGHGAVELDQPRPGQDDIGSFGNTLKLIVTFAGCSVVAHGFYALPDHTAAALRSGSALIRKLYTSLRPFFFSNGLLSFAPAMPRIRLRFQTLLFGLPAFMRCAALEPDGMFS
ncbi:hypothetical protein ALO51_101239 [Pseudomonas amygdali]|nr:hypothetical protein ALO51_101239 [Pseudomonas amygdali]